MLIKINKKLLLLSLSLLLNCSGTPNGDKEALQLYVHLKTVVGRCVDSFASSIKQVEIPQSFLYLLKQARIKYDREMMEFLRTPGLTGLPEALIARVAATRIDDDQAAKSIVQEMISLGSFELKIPEAQEDALQNFRNRIGPVTARYCVSLRQWEGYKDSLQEFLTHFGIDAIDRAEIAEDKFAIIDELLDLHQKFKSEAHNLGPNRISNFGKYLQKQLDYVLDVCRESGIDPKINKYDFILFLQMQGLPLVKKLQEAYDKAEIIEEIFRAYEVRDFSIKGINFEKWEKIYPLIRECQDKNMLQTLGRLDPALPDYPTSFYRAMLDPVNLTVWVWFCESKIREGQYISADQMPEVLPQEGERDLGMRILCVCSTLNPGIKFSRQNFGTFLQGEQTMFAFLDQHLVQFLERYAQDTDNNIPPPHPEKYSSVARMYPILKELKPHNPRWHENIDKVLGLIENETAKVAKHVQPYSEEPLIIIHP